jgi:transcriptional regulator with XRE-family HTH domain
MLCDASTHTALFPKALKRAREQLGLTDYQVAEKLQSSPSVIQGWESGRNLPQFSYFLMALEAYGLDFASFHQILADVYVDVQLSEIRERMDRIQGELDVMKERSVAPKATT